MMNELRKLKTTAKTKLPCISNTQTNYNSRQTTANLPNFPDNVISKAITLQTNFSQRMRQSETTHYKPVIAKMQPIPGNE